MAIQRITILASFGGYVRKCNRAINAYKRIVDVLTNRKQETKVPRKETKQSVRMREIEHLRAAMIRWHSKLDEINAAFDPARDCCTTCMTGGRDLVIVDKLERQAMLLRVMLRREGLLDEVSRLEFEHGKARLDELERTGGKSGNLK